MLALAAFVPDALLAALAGVGVTSRQPWAGVGPGRGRRLPAMVDCPFCALEGQLLVSTATVAAFADAHPLNAGHTLVCPRRHVADVFALDAGEWEELWRAVRQVQQLLASRLPADGWNLGVNSGSAAGQTMAHAHVHVIPRYHGDVADPRGGVRGVIPQRADYWSPQ